MFKFPIINTIKDYIHLRPSSKINFCHMSKPIWTSILKSKTIVENIYIEIFKIRIHFFFGQNITVANMAGNKRKNIANIIKSIFYFTEYLFYFFVQAILVEFQQWNILFHYVLCPEQRRRVWPLQKKCSPKSMLFCHFYFLSISLMLLPFTSP